MRLVTPAVRASIADQVTAMVRGHGLEITGWVDLVFQQEPGAEEVALMSAYLQAAQDAQKAGGMLTLISFPTGDGQGVLVPVVVRKP